MGLQVGLFERRVVVRPISIVRTISKLTNSFTMMKFLAMFCLFIALFNEMEAKPIEVKPWLLKDDMVSERKDHPKSPPPEDDDHPHPPPPEGEEDEAEVVDKREEEEDVEEEEDEGEVVEEREDEDEEDDHPHPPPPEDDDHPHP